MGNPKGRIISCIATGSVILAYGAPSALAPPPPDPVAILPSDTDAAIGTGGAPWSPDDEHLVFAPAPAPAGADHGLVLFLPGCGNIPEQYEEFMLTAQGQGYHVIGLAFPNECGLNNSCGTDLFCPGKYRHEVTFGNLAGPAPLLDAHDSIIYRLTALLVWLTSNHPGEGWGRFLTKDGPSPINPRWDKMVVAGHSIGAGYAAFLADSFVFRRVILISNPADAVDRCVGAVCPPSNPHCCVDPNPEPAKWLNGHATPSGRYFGLVHRGDMGENHFHRIQACWSELGLPAAHECIARCNAGPSCNASPLCDPTICDVCTNFHGGPAMDEDNYEETWIAMLGTP